MIRVWLVSMKYLLLLVWVIFGLSIQSRAGELFDNVMVYGKVMTAEEVIKDNLKKSDEDFASMGLCGVRSRISDHAKALAIVFDKSLVVKYPTKVKTLKLLREKLNDFSDSFTYAENCRTSGGFEIEMHAEGIRNEYFIEGLAYLIPNYELKYVQAESTQLRRKKFKNKLAEMQRDKSFEEEEPDMFAINYPKAKQEMIKDYAQVDALLDGLPPVVVERIITHAEQQIERENSELYDSVTSVIKALKRERR